ncbi:acyltransferase [Coniochaeta sp. 2T2.1]|nr:acyltransferase [Coniochaeta sp. 2T2.1]
MEKFSQFRDRGSGVAPFMPISTPSTPLTTLLHIALFSFRLPFFLFFTFVYFTTLHHLPFLPPALRKLLLWGLMAIPGIWWIDLQLDGVKRGALSSAPRSRVPYPGSVIAASYTSPLDVLYLAAVFDPVFTVSYAGSRKVRRVGLLGALWHVFSAPPTALPTGGGLTDLADLIKTNQDRVIAVFPEGGTTNGRGVLPLTPSLASVPGGKRIFPVSMRYTPPDITTPVPGLGGLVGFLWKLLSRPTHCIRVRIAEGVHNTAGATTNGVHKAAGGEEEGSGEVSFEEQKVLDKVAEDLARLGRSKRVGLTLRDKRAFVEAWRRKGKK